MFTFPEMLKMKEFWYGFAAGVFTFIMLAMFV